MFFPSSSEIINRRLSKDDPRRYLSQEDEIRKTYGDNIRLTQIHGEAYLRKLYGYDNIINSGGASNANKPIKIVKGEKLKRGVEGFLSNNGKTTHLVRFKNGVPQDGPVKIESLLGKYLLICCFNLPLLSDQLTATRCRALIHLYNFWSRRNVCSRHKVWSRRGGYPFEMVVVANLRTDVVYDLKAAFYHFYSAFSCLAIPFSDFDTRDFLHSSMHRGNKYDSQLAILVDPQGIILEDHYDLGLFFHYGSDWAPPFLPSTHDALEKNDEALRSRFDPMYSSDGFLSRDFAIGGDTVDDHRQQPQSLYRDILRCSRSYRLRRFDAAENDVNVSSTALELSRKYVGLYLFIDGDIMEDIKAAHDHCLANNQQLEILLVPMPFYDEPNSYNEQLRQALRSLKIKSWFLYLPNYRVRCRLWHRFAQVSDSFQEKFIIIPPDCKSCELYGREVITNLGFKEYPFTRTAILKRRLEYVRSLPPIFSSLFNNCLMVHNGQELKTEQLQGKNVLLYLSWSECDRYKLVKKHYPDIKAMGWEVVLVLLDDTDRYWNKQEVDNPIDCPKCPCLNLEELPWPFMLLPDAARASIKEKLFFPEDMHNVYLFAVGKDGKIVSRNVERRLNTDGVTESLFDDVLEADLARVLGAMPLFDAYVF